MNITINELKDYILQNSKFVSEDTIDIVIHNLIKYLKKNSFDLNNICVENNETSISFVSDVIVIRLTNVGYDGYKSLSDYVSHCEMIIQPLFEHKVNTGDIKSPTILGLKKLQIGNVTEMEKEVCYVCLRLDGYLYNDANKLENFGKDENGKVYLVNYNNLIYINDYKKSNRDEYQKFIERELSNHKKLFPELNKKYEEYKKFLIQFQVDVDRGVFNLNKAK